MSSEAEEILHWLDESDSEATTLLVAGATIALANDRIGDEILELVSINTNPNEIRKVCRHELSILVNQNI
jgi:hypothetical protein